MTELWRDIPGYEGRYQVSDKGRVRSVDREVTQLGRWGLITRRMKGTVLKPGRCRGYLIVNLVPGGTIAVHILVARAFIPNPEGLPEVNHEDGSKHNNAAGNLGWTTRRGNQLHAVEAGLNTQAKRITINGRTFPSITQAARALGCRASTVRRLAT